MGASRPAQWTLFRRAWMPDPRRRATGRRRAYGWRSCLWTRIDRMGADRTLSADGRHPVVPGVRAPDEGQRRMDAASTPRGEGYGSGWRTIVVQRTATRPPGDAR